MTNFTWNKWLGTLLPRQTARKPRRARVAQIEGLENRALLTANLPVAVADTYSVDQDTTLNASTSVLANDTDADGDTISQAVLQNNVTHGSLTLNANGTFTYIPTAGFTGSDTFTYFAKDVANNEQSATAATVTINVTANVAPAVSNVTLSGTINTPVTSTLTGTDADGDTLTFAEGSTAETGGTVVINPNGSFTFTPTNGFTGAATFSYRANDGSLNSTDATVTINISAAGNTAPVVNPVTLSTTMNTVVTGTLTGTDANGDTLTFAEGSTAETGGTVTINPNGSFTFTPTNGFTGAATFSYRANDGTTNSADATVTINVSAPNTAPIVIAGTGTTNLNTNLNGSLVSLATDAQGDPLTFAVVSQPSNGSVTVNSNGTFTFNPDTGFTGTTSFTFTANDGALTSNVGTFTVTVTDTTVADFDLVLVPSVTISNNPSSPTPLDPNAALTNVTAGTSFANAQLNVSFVSGLDSKKDRLVVNKHGSDGVTVKGKKIFVNGTQVATITSGKKKGTNLNVSFNSSATEASVEAVLRNVAIQTRPSASGATRVIEFQVSADGATATDTIDASLS